MDHRQATDIGIQFISTVSNRALDNFSTEEYVTSMHRVLGQGVPVFDSPSLTCGDQRKHFLTNFKYF
jgi:hypothetical protein